MVVAKPHRDLLRGPLARQTPRDVAGQLRMAAQLERFGPPGPLPRAVVRDLGQVRAVVGHGVAGQFPTDRGVGPAQLYPHRPTRHPIPAAGLDELPLRQRQPLPRHRHHLHSSHQPTGAMTGWIRMAVSGAGSPAGSWDGSARAAVRACRGCRWVPVVEGGRSRGRFHRRFGATTVGAGSGGGRWPGPGPVPPPIRTRCRTTDGAARLGQRRAAAEAVGPRGRRKRSALRRLDAVEAVEGDPAGAGQGVAAAGAGPGPSGACPARPAGRWSTWRSRGWSPRSAGGGCADRPCRRVRPRHEV